MYCFVRQVYIQRERDLRLIGSPYRFHEDGEVWALLPRNILGSLRLEGSHYSSSSLLLLLQHVLFWGQARRKVRALFGLWLVNLVGRRKAVGDSQLDGLVTIAVATFPKGGRRRSRVSGGCNHHQTRDVRVFCLALGASSRKSGSHRRLGDRSFFFFLGNLGGSFLLVRDSKIALEQGLGGGSNRNTAALLNHRRHHLRIEIDSHIRELVVAVFVFGTEESSLDLARHVQIDSNIPGWSGNVQRTLHLQDVNDVVDVFAFSQTLAVFFFPLALLLESRSRLVDLRHLVQDLEGSCCLEHLDLPFNLPQRLDHKCFLGEIELVVQELFSLLAPHRVCNLLEFQFLHDEDPGERFHPGLDSPNDCLLEGLDDIPGHGFRRKTHRVFVVHL
mmetsp:Transcript_6173/g.12750  ORF Transcript_6173/g.12750 Transcript_6173/m.12750 type:complete len:388 (+) Transcript_6173:197-1360(+)